MICFRTAVFLLGAVLVAVASAADESPKEVEKTSDLETDATFGLGYKLAKFAYAPHGYGYGYGHYPSYGYGYGYNYPKYYNHYTPSYYYKPYSSYHGSYHGGYGYGYPHSYGYNNYHY